MRRAEVERIRSAYRNYDEDPREIGKRSLGNRGNAAMAAELHGVLRGWLKRSQLDLTSARILDAGCGRGELVRRLIALGAQPENIVGVDLLPDRIEAAQAACPGVRFICGDVAEAQIEPQRLDLITCITLFGSLLDPEAAASVARALTDLLRPGGTILWCDSRYPNPWNRNVRGWSRRQVAGLFPGFQIQLEPTTLLPPLARRLGRWTDEAYVSLSRVRPLQARYAGLLRRPQVKPEGDLP